MGSRKTGYAQFIPSFSPAVGPAEFRIVTPEERVSPPGFMTIEVPDHLLREVWVYSMDEPMAEGTIVRAKVENVERPQIFERSDDHMNGSGWYMAGDNICYDWDFVSKLGEPEIVFHPDSMEECNCGCR